MRRGKSALLVLFLVSAVQATAAGPPTERLPAQSLVEDLQGGLGATHPADARPVPKIALELIKDFEGWSATAYDDPAGYCTICYGHLIARKLCSASDLSAFKQPVSRDDGERLLDKDTLSARSIVQDLVSVDLTAEQFGSLVSFTFNVGKGNFARSSLLRFVNSGDFELASQEFTRWVKAGGRVLPGLVTRRACEQMLFAGHLRMNNQGAFDRGACGSLGIAPGTSFLVDVVEGEF